MAIDCLFGTSFYWFLLYIFVFGPEKTRTAFENNPSQWEGLEEAESILVLHQTTFCRSWRIHRWP